MAEEIQKSMSIDEVENGANSDIEEHEMEEVDKNGTSAAPAEISKPEEETAEERKTRACRQGKLKQFIYSCRCECSQINIVVEFYFADSNLPYDKYD